MINKKNALMFKLSVLKVKYTHWRLIKHYLKILKFCIRHLDRICIPTTKSQNELMKKLLTVYDETIADLDKSVDIYRKRVIHYQGEE